jgi:hypothetical protein
MLIPESSDTWVFTIFRHDVPEKESVRILDSVPETY